MLGSFVGLNDYPAGSPIFGTMGQGDYSDLTKALQTGSGIVGSGTGATSNELSPLRVQSLENTLKVVTAGQKNLKLWPRLAKKKAMSTVEEYSRLDQLGGDTDAFMNEVGVPDENMEQYSRQTATIKFLGVKKDVSLVASLVNNLVGNLEAHEANIGTTELLLKIENHLLWGDSSINSQSWDGFVKMMTDYARDNNSTMSDIVYDMEGGAPDEDMMEEASARVAGHYGQMDYMLMGYQAKSDLQKSLFGYQRANMPANTNGTGAWGTPFSRYIGSQGEVDMDSSVFIKPVRCPAAAYTPPTISGKTPTFTDPTIVVAAVTGGDALTGALNSKIVNNRRYTYWITIGNIGMETTPSAGVALDIANTSTPTAIKVHYSAGNITCAYGSYVNVYRATTAYGVAASIDNATLVGRVKMGKMLKRDGSLAASTAFSTYPTTFEYYDGNQNRDNTSVAMGFTWDSDQVVAFKQLAPLMKLPLAITQTSNPFMLLLFGTPILYAPSKCCLIKNIGRLS